MTLTFDLPTPPDSLIRRFDPRWKLAAILASIAALVPLRDAGPVLAGFAGALLLVGLARLDWSWYFGRVKLVLPLLAGLLVFLPLVLHHDGVEAQVWFLKFSLYGFLVACRVALKIIAILSLVLVLIATTPIPTLLKAAQALRIPGFLIHLTSLTWRYLFLVVEEFGRIRTALRVRGYRSGANVHSYRVVGLVTGTLLVRSAERAERVGQAMRCRGFDGRFRSLTDFSTAPRDIFLFISIMATVLVLLFWQFAR